MKLPRLPKLPKFSKFSKFKLPPMQRPKRKLDARVRTGAAPLMDDYDEDEPQTKLSSAFIVVLLLHVVAVGGIYAFNSIKASRRSAETPAAATAKPSAATAKTTPVEPQPAAAPTSTAAPVASVVPVSKQRVYTVKPGDTLTSIARQFAVNVSDTAAANGLKPGATLRVGQVLNVPAKNGASVSADAGKPETRSAAPAAEPKAATQSYTVKSGDRLLFIAKRFNVTPEALVAANKLKDPGKLQVGQTLKIPKKGN